MSQKAVILFTEKSVERILAEGGTSSWRLDRNHARRCTYAVCTRNAKAAGAQGPETHRSAFVVGKVRDVVVWVPPPEDSESGEDRYLIRFSEFARVSIPNVWKGDRNPVRYRLLEDIGIDASALKWEAMPEQRDATESGDGAIAIKPDGVKPLTFAEAKKGLAVTFNVAPEAIEIIIRG